MLVVLAFGFACAKLTTCGTHRSAKTRRPKTEVRRAKSCPPQVEVRKGARRPSLNMERCLHYYLFINAREVLQPPQAGAQLKPTNDCTQRQPPAQTNKQL